MQSHVTAAKNLEKNAIFDANSELSISSLIVFLLLRIFSDLYRLITALISQSESFVEFDYMECITLQVGDHLEPLRKYINVHVDH